MESFSAFIPIESERLKPYGEEVVHGFYSLFGSKHPNEAACNFLRPLAQQVLSSIEQSGVILLDNDIRGLLAEVGASIRFDCAKYNKTIGSKDGNIEYSIQFIPIMPMSHFKMTQDLRTLRAYKGKLRPEIVIAKDPLINEDIACMAIEIGFDAEYTNRVYSNFGYPSLIDG